MVTESLTTESNEDFCAEGKPTTDRRLTPLLSWYFREQYFARDENPHRGAQSQADINDCYDIRHADIVYEKESLSESVSR